MILYLIQIKRNMETIKTILVPTDFSEVAKNALIYAVNMAKEIKAKLIVLHVYYIPVLTGTKPYVLSPDLLINTTDLINQQLHEIELDNPEINQVKHEFLSMPGYTAAEINIAAKNQKADLIIMGTLGASGLQELLVGSNTASVIEEAFCPVLAIPVKAKFKSIKNIAFAYDHDAISVPLEFKTLIPLAESFKAEISIFHVKTYDKELISEEKESPRLQYEQPVKHTYTSFYEEDIEEGINNFIQAKNIDILAMMPRKHNLFYKLFKSSLTKKMAFHTKIPLLAILD